MKVSKVAKKEINNFLHDIMIIYKLTKEDLNLLELGMINIYKQGIIEGLQNISKENK